MCYEPQLSETGNAALKDGWPTPKPIGIASSSSSPRRRASGYRISRAAASQRPQYLRYGRGYPNVRLGVGRCRGGLVSAAMVRAQAAGQALQGERGAPEVGGARLSISSSNIVFVGFLHRVPILCSAPPAFIQKRAQDLDLRSSAPMQAQWTMTRPFDSSTIDLREA